MVTIRWWLHCEQCDNEDLEYLPGDHEERIVFCPRCGLQKPLRELQDKAQAETKRFMDEGLKAVRINKHMMFG